MVRKRKSWLYSSTGEPVPDFNELVLQWLRGEEKIREHRTPAAFDSLRTHYDATLASIQATGQSERTDGLSFREGEDSYGKNLGQVPDSVSPISVQRELLSNLTNLMNGVDLTQELTQRLSDARINRSGTRSTLSQGVMKNSGENFVNVIVYALANILSGQDEVLVDKGLPSFMRPHLTMTRQFMRTNDEPRDLKLVIESDFCIFSRSNPLNAIVCSAKTRLKEVFHIGTMWKLFFDVLDDQHCKDKWGLSGIGGTTEMDYVFVTADNIREGGSNSQGPDLKPDGVRNLLALDASFFDYVFVSKTGLDYVSSALDYKNERESLFHELGCLVDMIQVKYGLDWPQT